MGARFYQYDVKSSSAADFPLANTVFGFDDDDGNRVFYTPDEINLDFKNISADDDGSLFKVNASYQFSDDIMAYATVSEGFRIGGSNGIGLCNEGTGEQQSVCAQPDG